MASSHPLSKPFLPLQTKKEEDQRIYQCFRDPLSTLPTIDGCSVRPLLPHPDGWFGTVPVLVGAMVAHRHFQAKPADVLLATFPKSGTTWLKALSFATMNRNTSNIISSPLATLSPHDCIPFLESQAFVKDHIPDLSSLPSPRLFATHIPFHSLPDSIMSSGARIVYLYRNPKDNFISLWHFINKLRAQEGIEPLSLEVGLDRFCEGISMFGPYWDHVLGYWKASLEDGNKVLFMRYEELMEDTSGQLKRLAEFVGSQFTVEEEKDGVVEEITRLCGFENLSNLEVNKAGTTELVHGALDNCFLFRRGKVGDWVDHLTPEMARRVDEITESRFNGSGLSF